MDRRNFLAFLPGIAALPVMGDDFKQTKSGIMLRNPKPIEIPDLDKINMNPSKYILQIVEDQSKIVKGEGFATEVEIRWDTIRIGNENVAGAKHIYVKGVLNYFNP